MLDGYLPEREVATQRGKSLRTLRGERQRGKGPSYVRDGRTVLYPVDGFREWLRANERQPVRSESSAPEPRRAPRALRGVTPAAQRKRQREFETVR